MTRRKTNGRLTLAEYQERAKKTDLTGDDPQDGLFVSVLGIVGESGDLATLFKKKLRDGDSYTMYPEQCAEELGDILWYVANVSTKLDLSLEDIAQKNLTKTKARWKNFTASEDLRPLLDEGFPEAEQFPRTFSISFVESTDGKRHQVALFRDGKAFGDSLTDNAHFEDGYRYHDVFHLAYAAVLGWSPVTRKLLGCKRRSSKAVDEVEDGGRATVIEEAVSALAFQYAEKHNMLDAVGRVDSDLLSTIARLTEGFEVGRTSAGEWENAILTGFKVFRLLNRHRGGTVSLDLRARTLLFKKSPKAGQSI